MAETSKLEQFGMKVAANMSPGEAAIDPATFQLILELIKELIPLITSCMENRRLRKEAKAARGEAVAKIRARRMMGRKAYRECGEEMVEALIKTTIESDDKEIRDVYDEVMDD